jgi:hypothetical protein
MTAHLSTIIKQQLATHYRYRAAVDEPWTYPSEAFEKKAGVTGISCNYAMPAGKDPKDIYVSLAACEAEHELISGYCALAEEMGGLSAEHWHAFATRLQEEKAVFQKEFSELQASGSLDAVEEKAAEGYKLQSKLKALAGLRDLIQAGGTPEELDALNTAAKHKVKHSVDSTYAALEQLNPELSVLTSQIETHAQKRFVVLGALSKYNVADIKGFSIDGITWREARKDPTWARQWDEIQRQTGGELDGWIPAKSTQMRILDQLRQRQPKEMAVG